MPTAGATSYAIYCAAGAFGPTSVLARSPADGSWSLSGPAAGGGASACQPCTPPLTSPIGSQRCYSAALAVAAPGGARVFAASATGYVLAVEAATGALAWSASLADLDPSWSGCGLAGAAPFVDACGNVIVACTGLAGSRIYALRGADGALLDKTEGAN